MGGGAGLGDYLRTHQYTLGWHHAVPDAVRDWDEGWDKEWDEMQEGETIPAAGEMITGIQELEIEAGPGSMEIREESREDSQDTALRIVHEDGSALRYRIYQEEDTLKIELPSRIRDLSGDWRMETLTIYVPAGFRFREVNVETMAGSFYADALYADQLELESKSGSISIKGGRAGNLEVDCMAGAIECLARVERGADADCKAGSLIIAMAEAKDQYNYELDCKTGTITMVEDGEEVFSSLWQKKHIDHGSGKTVELDCAAGEITVQFPASL